MGNVFINETKAPLLAPRWTRVGYSGKLKDAVIDACNEHRSDEHQSDEHQPDNQHQHSMELAETDNDKHEEEEGGKEEVEVTVLLTSNDRVFDQISDDDEYLEMDDE